jgi:hypothetical protein
MAHFQREIDAIDREIDTGLAVATPIEHLDASSDAMAYVVGHWRRLTSPVTAELHGGVLRRDRDYFDDVRRYRDFIVDTLDRLLFGALTVDLQRASVRRQGRQLWDWLGRAAQGGMAVWRKLRPLLADAASDLGAAMTGQAGPPLASWRDRLVERLTTPKAALVMANGESPAPDSHPGLAQLTLGLNALLPATMAVLTGLVDHPIAAFAASVHFRRRQHLGERLIAWLDTMAVAPQLVALARFEQALAQSTTRCDQVERLSTPAEDMPAQWRDGHLVPSSAFRLLSLAFEVADWHAALLGGESDSGAPLPRATTYLVGRHFESVAVVPASQGIVGLWQALEGAPMAVAEAMQVIENTGDISEIERPGGHPWPTTAEAWILELLAAGAVGWMPRLPRPTHRPS